VRLALLAGCGLLALVAPVAASATSGGDTVILGPQPPRVGELLVAHTPPFRPQQASATRPVGFTHQWQRCTRRGCQPPHAAGSLYHVLPADQGYALLVSAVAAGQEAHVVPLPAWSMVVIGPPLLRERPRIRGVARRGQWLHVQLRGRDFGWVIYSWERCRQRCVPVKEGRWYRVSRHDRGARLRVVVDIAGRQGEGIVRTTRMTRTIR
jgi:hypothetical protein